MLVGGPARSSAWDQAHATAMDSLRTCKGFFLVAVHDAPDGYDTQSFACGWTLNHAYVALSIAEEAMGTEYARICADWLTLNTECECGDTDCVCKAGDGE